MKKMILYVLCMALILAGCGVDDSVSDNLENVQANNQIEEANRIIEDVFSFDSDNTDMESEGNNILLNGNSINFSGLGAKVDGSNIVISSKGIYTVSGTLDNGSIIIDAGTDDVNLILDGANIKSDSTSPINIISAGKAVLTLRDGTENSVQDGSSYVQVFDEPDSAIFSKTDLVINGSGKLNVKASYNDGIKSKDTLTIMNGSIEVDSVDDGIVGKDFVAIKEGNINIVSGGDGIKSTNDTDSTKGYVVIQGGNIRINGGADGIQAETNVIIDGGSFDITTGGGSDNNESQSAVRVAYLREKEKLTTEDNSNKGIKAKSNITINSGNFVINSLDDAIHSNNSIVIGNGKIEISSGDDGIHADLSISILGGDIDINKSYEGIESTNITIDNGFINVNSTDDGINVAGGNDGSSINGRMGQNGFKTNSNNKITINGGAVNVNASGDGLDANGSIYITGGEVFVNGPSGNGNGALDYDGVFEISGGSLIAIGSSGMAQVPSNSSTQYSFAVNSSNKSGDNIKVKEGNGDIILEMTAMKDFSSIIVSSNRLEKDKTYYIYINDEKLQEITINDIVTGVENNMGMNRENRRQGKEDEREFLNKNMRMSYYSD